MTPGNDDVSAVRRAVRAVEQTSAVLLRRYGDSLDARRLAADVGRLAADLDLLCGPEQAPAPPPRPAPEVIPDTSYAHDFWMDAEDEGLGSADPRRR